LRRTVHTILSRQPEVESFAQASEHFGGWGATIVHLRRERFWEGANLFFDKGRHPRALPPHPGPLPQGEGTARVRNGASDSPRPSPSGRGRQPAPRWASPEPCAAVRRTDAIRSTRGGPTVLPLPEGEPTRYGTVCAPLRMSCRTPSQRRPVEKHCLAKPLSSVHTCAINQHNIRLTQPATP